MSELLTIKEASAWATEHIGRGNYFQYFIFDSIWQSSERLIK